MKKFLIIFILSLATVQLKSQTALQYVPTQVGNVWVMNNYVLDSTGTPVGQPQVLIDSTVAYQIFKGKQSLFVIRRPPNVNIGDTNWIAPSGQSIFTHQRSIQIDTIFTLNLPDWFEYYRFATSLGSFYTIYRFDTTLTVPQLGTLPLRFLLRGARLGLDTVTVPAGFFFAVKFKIEAKVQYLISLPPPLPPFAIDLVTIPFNDWLAQGRYLIKSVQEPFRIDTLGLSLPGTMRELVEFRSASSVDFEDMNSLNYVLNQNFPNPFNSKTVISFYLPKDENVTIKVYNSLGQQVTELLNEFLVSGMHSIEFDANRFNLTSGVYFYSLETRNKKFSRSMIYLK
ncbi:MAG: T9SS type A sorting domain-containing protein [Ignavibacteria bacterium]|nr:T9SS type A sorting domain-containing protein [Ignavibacteria bacterium]